MQYKVLIELYWARLGHWAWKAVLLASSVMVAQMHGRGVPCRLQCRGTRADSPILPAGREPPQTTRGSGRDFFGVLVGAPPSKFVWLLGPHIRKCSNPGSLWSLAKGEGRA
jgi:hypothetical protein